MGAISDKIWITRKARIYTEQRLINKSLITQAIMIFYSFGLVSISLCCLINPNEYYTIYSIISSLAVFVSSVFISSQRFSERAMMIRNCYIRLDDLYSRSVQIENEGDEGKIFQIESEYANILLNVENHSDYDFLCLRYSLRKNIKTSLPRFTCSDILKYFIYKFYRVLLSIIILFLPFIISSMWIKVVKYVSIN